VLGLLVNGRLWCYPRRPETTTIRHVEHDHQPSPTAHHHDRTTSKQAYLHVHLLMRLPLSLANSAAPLFWGGGGPPPSKKPACKVFPGSSGWIRQWESLELCLSRSGRSYLLRSLRAWVLAGPGRSRNNLRRTIRPKQSRPALTQFSGSACVGDWRKDLFRHHPPFVAHEPLTPAQYKSMYPQEHGPCPCQQ